MKRYSSLVVFSLIVLAGAPLCTESWADEEALRVGATIEDLDIYDLRRLLEEVDNRDIQIAINGHG